MGGLQLARLDAITRIGNLAGEHDVSHILVAGDVYDHATPSPHTRNRVVERMRAYTSIQWHMLPGNHDSYQPNGLWDQLRRRGLPGNIHAHTESAATIIEQDAAVLLPAPLQHRRTLNDPTDWMDDHVSEAGLIRIGLAHGAVYGFDSNEEQRANPIDPTRPTPSIIEPHSGCYEPSASNVGIFLHLLANGVCPYTNRMPNSSCPAAWSVWTLTVPLTGGR